jgi:hypothetical protein
LKDFAGILAKLALEDPKGRIMPRFRQGTYPSRDEWILQFRERVTPRLRNLFTSKHDFTVLPDIIAEPLRRLALAEQQRG